MKFVLLGKKSNDRLTVMLYVNLIKKFEKLLIIGKSKNSVVILKIKV